MNASEQYHIRAARLDDTHAIAVLFQNQIPVWQRMTPGGGVESLPYDALTIYERWTHGGPWMSDETAAIHLSRLLRGAGMTLLAESTSSGEITAYAELYPGDEPEPFGAHLHLGQLIWREDHQAQILLRALIDLAQSSGGKLTVSLPTGVSDDTAGLYRDLRLEPLSTVQRYHLPARTGQGFYKVNEHPQSSAAQVDGWQMPVGRLESARQHWEELWPRTWEILPETNNRQIHRLAISASGHEAFLCCKQQINPRSADVYVWSARKLSPPLLTAIRDWAHRHNYRTLSCVVTAEGAKILGAEAEADPVSRTTYSVKR